MKPETLKGPKIIFSTAILTSTLQILHPVAIFSLEYWVFLASSFIIGQIWSNT
jgi:hypothetical protein